jgi:hypothetical protein
MKFQNVCAVLNWLEKMNEMSPVLVSWLVPLRNGWQPIDVGKFLSLKHLFILLSRAKNISIKDSFTESSETFHVNL